MTVTTRSGHSEIPCTLLYEYCYISISMASPVLIPSEAPLVPRIPAISKGIGDFCGAQLTGNAILSRDRVQLKAIEVVVHALSQGFERRRYLDTIVGVLVKGAQRGGEAIELLASVFP